MCSIKADGNGGHHLRFGPREWMGLIGISLTAAILVGTIMWSIVDLKIEAAIAVHSASQIHKETP